MITIKIFIAQHRYILDLGLLKIRKGCLFWVRLDKVEVSLSRWVRKGIRIGPRGSQSSIIVDPAKVRYQQHIIVKCT